MPQGTLTNLRLWRVTYQDAKGNIERGTHFLERVEAKISQDIERKKASE